MSPTPSSNGPLIRVRDLSKVYATAEKKLKGSGVVVRALDHLDLDIQAGEYIAIVGPSGSGKSTLMQILGLLDRPTSGSISLAGYEMSELNDDQIASLRNRAIGFIFQFFNLLARTTALANVALPAIYARHPNPQARAKTLLEKVGLGDRLHHAPHQLSGGQQQRVAIARALVNSPSILFADEPTGNISSQQAVEVMEELDRLNREEGVTLIVVTHETDIAAHARRVITMKDGKIISDVQNRPEHKNMVKDRQIAVPKSTVIPGFSEILENVKMALIALSLNKFRTFLTMLGIIIGVAAVIAMTAIGDGAKEAVKQRLASLGSNLLMVFPGNQDARGSGSAPKFTLMDLLYLRQVNQQESMIRHVDGCVGGGVLVSYGDQNWSTRVTGCEYTYEDMRASKPVTGRFFTEKEDQQRAKVCLLGVTVVKSIYPPDFNPTGTQIKINKINFQVLGVLPVKGATYRDEDDVVIVPLHTAMYRLLGLNTINYIDVDAKTPEGVDGCIQEVSQILRHTRHIQPGKLDDFTVRNMSDIQQAQQDTVGTLTTMISMIALLSLFVGGIGIMNIMLVSVRERTKEIGLRKALGAHNMEVMFQFLVESILIGVIGGFIGILIGSSGAISTAVLAGWPISLPWGTVFLAVFISAGTGIIFGIWPAWQASKLSPIEALRYE